ncbi:kelch repeat-containing protein [Streptomyces sp. NA02950]|uniref:Kelch repeat-containing protein n=1 Tax=Streptomyces sp. NA02950 TaxID=2742137 RepID=UPI001591B657|nr:kelch repeat-containing protein [Streptomyces sp. NA02950]QKV96048.1 kelch repeat-containing protein [Streptomyces sp. NA02950]
MRQWSALLLGAVLVAAPTAQAYAHPDPTTHPPAEAPAAAEPSYGKGWRPLAPIASGPRQEHSVAAVGDKVYVIGGIVPDSSGGFTTTGRMEVYDTRRGTWSDAAPLPVAMNHPNVAAVGGRIYVLGGLSGGASWQALGDSFVYDPHADRWRRLPSMPAGIERGSAAMGVHGSRIYLAGGMRTLTPSPGGLQDTVDTVSSYDVVTGRWRTLPSLPQARDHVGGAVVGATFYVIGGRDRGQVNVRDTVYAYDLRSRRWSQRAPMPTARGGIATAIVGTKIYTFGGEGKHDGSGPDAVFDQTEAYDTRHDRWQRLAPMPVPRHGTAAVAVGGTIYIPGGGTAGGGRPVDVNDAYRPAGR